MMHGLFTLKELGFYGAAISIVVGLFTATTHYGEANLKAPTKITGRYRIDAKEFPGCLKAESRVLSIEQSGIYLSGSLLESEESTRTQTAAKKKPSLTGLWEKGNVTLSGVPKHLESCAQENASIEIHGTVVKNLLEGELKVGNERVKFVAQHEEDEQKTHEK
jgi:hypothetical protein